MISTGDIVTSECHVYVSLTSKLWSKHATNFIALQGVYEVHTKVQ